MVFVFLIWCEKTRVRCWFKADLICCDCTCFFLVYNTLDRCVTIVYASTARFRVGFGGSAGCFFSRELCILKLCVVRDDGITRTTLCSSLGDGGQVQVGKACRFPVRSRAWTRLFILSLISISRTVCMRSPLLICTVACPACSEVKAISRGRSFVLSGIGHVL